MGGIKKKFQINALKMVLIMTMLISKIKENKEIVMSKKNAGILYPHIGIVKKRP
jgi:hypothetical protein